MPLEPWHKAKAAHNLACNAYLKSATGQYIDWEITTLFYTALHMVDILLTRRGIHPKSHEKMKEYTTLLFPEIRQPYISLYHASRKARYTTDTYTMERDQATRDCNEIRRFVEARAGYAI